MVNKDDNVADLIFKQKLDQQKELKKLKRKKRTSRFITFLVLASALFFYVISDISKPKIVSISGNNVIDKDEVIKYAKADLNSMMILSNPISIKYRLLKHPLIDDVSTHMSLFKRYININIKEVEIFGYRQGSEDSMIIMLDGSSLELTPEYYQFLPFLIFIEGFDEQELQDRLVESFSSLDDSVLKQISEIHHTSVSYDANLVEVRMNDGNKIYTSFQTVDRLNYYFDIAVNLNANNSCIYIDEMSGEAYSQPCEVKE